MSTVPKEIISSQRAQSTEIDGPLVQNVSGLDIPQTKSVLSIIDGVHIQVKHPAAAWCWSVFPGALMCMCFLSMARAVWANTGLRKVD